MEKAPYQEPSLAKALLIAIALILLCAIISAIGLFWIFPALGIAIAITAGAWGIIIATVFLLCVALLLFFIVPFFLIFLISLLSFLWVLAAIVLFPIVFPIIIPIFIILLFVGYLRKKKQKTIIK